MAPRTEATRQEILRLAAAPIDEEEVRRLDAELTPLLREARKAPAPKKASMKTRVFGPTFRRGAAPGPSGTRNAYVKALAEVPGGIDALRGFAEVEVRGLWDEADHLMWHSGLIEPADCGERAPVADDAAPERKLRPLAQTEALVKLVETAVIDEVAAELRERLEPHQLGVAAAPRLVWYHSFVLKP